jgi:hypothetical protein
MQISFFRNPNQKNTFGELAFGDSTFGDLAFGELPFGEFAIRRVGIRRDDIRRAAIRRVDIRRVAIRRAATETVPNMFLQVTCSAQQSPLGIIAIYIFGCNCASQWHFTN